ncbi:MAG: hypothetical protein ACKOQW_08130 [Phycisphaerales bacterium]
MHRPSFLPAALGSTCLAASIVGSAHASIQGILANNSNNAAAFSNLSDQPGNAPVSFYRANGSNYGGIATKVTGGTLAVGPNPGQGNTWYGSTAWLHGGVASSNTNVVMSWRTATTAERIGTSTVPPMPDSAGYNSVSGDVLSLTGIGSTGAAVQRTIGGVTYTLNPTDAFAIEMTYNPANMIASYQFGSTMGWDLDDIRASGEAQMTYYNPSTNQWSKTLIVNVAGANGLLAQNQNFAGAYEQFATLRGLTASTDLTSWVGSWGFAYSAADGTGAADTYRMWAILDHNSAFGPTPAPGALAVLGMAGLVSGSRRRRA